MVESRSPNLYCFLKPSVPDEDELNRTIPVNTPYWMNPPNKRKGPLSNPVGSPGLRATWLGHATCLVEIDGAVILTDPLFSDWAGACPGLGSKRFRPPRKLTTLVRRIKTYFIFYHFIAACYVEDLPDKIDAVFVSHNHYDHLDKKSVRDLHSRYGDKLHWFLPMDMGEWFIRKVSGINKNSIHELVWWQEEKVPNTKVK